MLDPEIDEPILSPVDAGRRSRLRIAVVLTLVVAVVVVGAFGLNFLSPVAALLDPPYVPPAPRVPIRLAVVDDDGGLAIVDPATEAATGIGREGLAHEFPAWSPDGTRVAAIGRAEGSGGIYAYDPASGADPEPVYVSRDRQPFYLSWSPDGTRITFLTSEPQGQIALRVAPADGGGEDTVLRRGSPLYWDWVDDNRLLIHAGSTHVTAFLGEIGLDAESEAATAIEPGFFRPPVVGRDGRYRAYVSPADEGHEVVIERHDGSDRRTISAEGSVALAFDPAGRKLAFTALGRPTSEPPALPIGPLHVVDATTGEERTLLDRPTIAFYWSPDGRTIAALELLPAEAPGVDIASAGLGGRVAVAQPPGVTVQVRFVDVASGDVRSEQPIRVSDLYGFQVLPFFDQYGLSHRTWSADSAGISLPRVDAAGRSRIVVVPADGSEPRGVADGAIGFWSP